VRDAARAQPMQATVGRKAEASAGARVRPIGYSRAANV